MDPESDSDFEQFQAKAVWEFKTEGDGESGELDVAAGEIVTVLADEAPWSRVINQKGEQGYVPSNYLQQIDSRPAPPPPPRVVPQQNHVYVTAPTGEDDPPTPTGAAPMSPPSNAGWYPPPDNMDDGHQGTTTPKKKKRPRRARRDTSSMDESVAYNLFAAGTEWWCCLCLFFSGIFSVMWGSIQSPEDTGMEALGCVQCILAGVLLFYFALFRETCCFCSEACQEKTSLLRMSLVLAATIPGWAAYPFGWIGVAACCIAAAANALVYFQNGKVLEDEGVEVQWLTMNIEIVRTFNNSGILVGVFLVFMAFMNVLFYMVGEGIGEDRIDEELKDHDLILGKKYSIAEGFGTVISFNILLLILTCLVGLQEWVAEHAGLHKGEGKVKDMVVNCGEWFFKAGTQMMLHRVFSAAVAVAAVGHIAANFLAYEDSGPANDYYDIFGPETVVTGFLLIIFLIPIYASSNPKIKTLNEDLYKYANLCWIIVIVLLLLHGKADPIPWNTNAWKFLLAPILLYAFDTLYLRGKADGRDV